MTYAAIDGDAGECASNGVGEAALTIVPPPSLRHSGQINTSCIYRMRSTLAGVIRSSSRTGVVPTKTKTAGLGSLYKVPPVQED